jgi:hypothetical protein
MENGIGVHQNPEDHLPGFTSRISMSFKTREAAEKARLKYPERERGAIGVGVVKVK